LSRQKDDTEVIEFFVSNFVACNDPQALWIGEIMQNGEQSYTDWKKRTQSLTYVFRQEVESVFTGQKFDDMFKLKGLSHPQVVKEHLIKNISLETFIILDRILGFKKTYDKKLDDPVWKFLSMRMDKYNTFLKIDIFKYKKLLKDIVV
tara:strand:- start:5736 stop:6179 length:444 start_codon:yes stop_codon:yes gene_type:complete